MIFFEREMEVMGPMPMVVDDMAVMDEPMEAPVMEQPAA